MADNVALRTGHLYDERAPANVEVQRVAVALAASGDLVAAVAGKSIRVVGLFLVLSGTGPTVQFVSNPSATALTGTVPPPLPFGWNPNGHFQTNSGEKLSVTLGGTPSVQGWLDYILVT
jgi:hypothetical protein